MLEIHQHLSSSNKVLISSIEEDAGTKELAWQYAEICAEIYSGGICWIRGDQDNIGEQLINFAIKHSDQIFSDDMSLFENLNECWSNWSQDDTLIIITNAGSYQEVRKYLPPGNRQFNLIVTVEKSLETVWTKNSFPVCCLEPLEDGDLTVAINSRAKDFTLLFGGWVVSQSICTISLKASYVRVNSAAWIANFQSHGWVIEFLRSCILYFLFGALFTFFRREATELYMSPSVLTKRKFFDLRLFIIAGGVLCTALVFDYHLNDAPINLAAEWGNNPALNTEEGFRLYKLPYLYYFPYSFINFIVIGITAISIGLYAVYKDVDRLYTFKVELNKELGKVQKFVRTEVGKVLFKEVLCRQVEYDFENFSRRLTNTLYRYTFLFLIFAIGVAFEVLFGYPTLSKTALTWLTGGYAFLGMVGAGMLLSYSQYESALNPDRSKISAYVFIGGINLSKAATEQRLSASIQGKP